MLDERPAGCAGLLFARDLRQRRVVETALAVAEIESAQPKFIRRFAERRHRDQRERCVRMILPDGDVVGRDRQPTEPEKISAGLRDLTDLPPCNLSCANVCHGNDSVRADVPAGCADRPRWLAAGTDHNVMRGELSASRRHTHGGVVVPAERIELPTFGLQNRCSTAELNRLPG